MSPPEFPACDDRRPTLIPDHIRFVHVNWLTPGPEEGEHGGDAGATAPAHAQTAAAPSTPHVSSSITTTNHVPAGTSPDVTVFTTTNTIEGASGLSESLDNATVDDAQADANVQPRDLSKGVLPEFVSDPRDIFQLLENPPGLSKDRFFIRRVAVLLPCFNEENYEIIRTLLSLRDGFLYVRSMELACQSRFRTVFQVVVVQDGILKAHSTFIPMVAQLLAAFAADGVGLAYDTTSRQQEGLGTSIDMDLETPGDKFNHYFSSADKDDNPAPLYRAYDANNPYEGVQQIAYDEVISTLEYFRQEQKDSEKLPAAEAAVVSKSTMVLESRRWDSPGADGVWTLSFIIKARNQLKHNSHDWFLRPETGFAAHNAFQYMYLTDAGTTFAKTTVHRLIDYLDLHPKTVAVTGRQRVMGPGPAQRFDPDVRTGPPHWPLYKEIRDRLLSVLPPTPLVPNTFSEMLRAVQQYDYETAFACLMGAFNLAGFLPVLPGPCGLFRCSAMYNTPERSYSHLVERSTWAQDAEEFGVESTNPFSLDLGQERDPTLTFGERLFQRPWPLVVYGVMEGVFETVVFGSAFLLLLALFLPFVAVASGAWLFIRLFAATLWLLSKVGGCIAFCHNELICRNGCVYSTGAGDDSDCSQGCCECGWWPYGRRLQRMRARATAHNEHLPYSGFQTRDISGSLPGFLKTMKRPSLADYFPGLDHGCDWICQCGNDEEEARDNEDIVLYDLDMDDFGGRQRRGRTRAARIATPAHDESAAAEGDGNRHGAGELEATSGNHVADVSAGYSPDSPHVDDFSGAQQDPDVSATMVVSKRRSSARSARIVSIEDGPVVEATGTAPTALTTTTTTATTDHNNRDYHEERSVDSQSVRRVSVAAASAPLQSQPMDTSSVAAAADVGVVVVPPCPAKWYLDSIKDSTANPGIVKSNLVLAEDRILTLAIVLKTNAETPSISMVSDAVFYFEPETEIEKFVAQRRRWTNGSFAGYIFLATNLDIIWSSNMTFPRQLFVVMLCILQLIIYSFFAISPGLFLAMFDFVVSAVMPSSVVEIARGDRTFLWGMFVLLYVLYMGVHASGVRLFRWSFVIIYFIGVIVMIGSMKKIFEDVALNPLDTLHLAIYGDKDTTPVTNRLTLELIVAVYMTYPLSTLFYSPTAFVHIVAGFVPFYMFLPTFVIGMGGFSFSRLWEVTWGNRSSEVHLQAETQREMKQTGWTLTAIIVILNLIIMVAVEVAFQLQIVVFGMGVIVLGCGLIFMVFSFIYFSYSAMVMFLAAPFCALAFVLECFVFYVWRLSDLNGTGRYASLPDV